MKPSDLNTIKRNAGIIAAALDAIDNRCLAADGPVLPTLAMAEPSELRKIYCAADRIRRTVNKKGK